MPYRCYTVCHIVATLYVAASLLHRMPYRCYIACCCIVATPYAISLLHRMPYRCYIVCSCIVATPYAISLLHCLLLHRCYTVRHIVATPYAISLLHCMFVQTHMRNLWKSADDPSRCDFHLRGQAGVPGIITEPAGVPGIITEPAGVPLITEPAGVPLIEEPDGVPPHVSNVCELARRQPASTRDQFEARKAYTITAANSSCDVTNARDLVVVQDAWDTYLREIKDLCSEQFWTLFLRLHRFSGVMIDTCLSSVKKVFRNLQSNDAWKEFPASRRTLLGDIAKLRDFWPLVTHSVNIDLSQFKLPSGTKEVEFHFLDPCWSWLVAARRQHPLDLHWKPRSQPRFCPVYGGGCQFGEAMAQACRSCPPGTYPMCVTLHWDERTWDVVHADMCWSGKH